MPGKAHHDGPLPDGPALELAEATLGAIESTGGFAGGVYLRSGTPGLLRLAVLAGLPARLFHPWWRMHINRPYPVAEAYRSGDGIHLADAEDAMRRFPQLMAGLPFPFGSLYAPVTGGGDRFGVLVVLRAATPGRPVDLGDRRRMHHAAQRLGSALADLAADGAPVSWDDAPVNVQLPAGTTAPVRIGHLAWDPGTGTVTTDEALRTILGAAPERDREPDPERDRESGSERDRESGSERDRESGSERDREPGRERDREPGSEAGPSGSHSGAHGSPGPPRPESGSPGSPRSSRPESGTPDASGPPGPSRPDSGALGAPGPPGSSSSPGSSRPDSGRPDVSGPPGPARPESGVSGSRGSSRQESGMSGSWGRSRPEAGSSGSSGTARPESGAARPESGAAESDGSLGTTFEALAARLAPEDTYGLWTVARRVAAAERPTTRRIWLRGDDGRPCLLELSGTGRDPSPGGAPHGAVAGRVVGAVVDVGTGPVVAAAADRLPRGIFSIDRLGRITFVSRSAETLLGRPRPELLGHDLWEALPWFAHPAYEDHFRAALISDEPVHFLAHRAPQKWLSVSLYPGHEGLTVTLAGAEQPAYAPGSVVSPGAGLGSPADRASVLYRPVALAIALTEAVTARQVSAVVTEELLPAFGGRQLAIYLLNERQLHLAWETGFPKGFLDRFDGVGLDARLPGVETLTSGRPLFFESMQRLAAAYPGIPLDAHVGARAFLPLIASGRPVGSCILGFDQPRGFSPEERTVLTALAGLIAQALHRARRYDSEFALARGLQDALLPHRLPRLPDVETVGRYLPGTQGMEVGGDWYDVVETGRGGGLALVIGDVQGHGVSAAATMGQLRSALRAFALSGHDPHEVMSGTNRLLIDLDAGQFASCCYVVLDPATGVARAVRAGHPQPLLRHPDGRTEVLDLPGGVVLGVDPEATYPVTELRLAPGDVLALFTDGLVEQPGTDIDLGIERLRGTLAGVRGGSLADTADLLIREARAATDRPDDIALLLAARVSAGPAERGCADKAADRP
ncbi:SpoIIE family protein phosphatase [Streptomyces ficellus]|uniref:SpoIIE family protein phosphatase n=1 Tax=Streptomyces ficellus TaxID=1977088 RepID=A0ABT7Z965_9ACTN|nr:SpoIIE family protein phosphatase [Streptomyces ficellus]MDN3296039.1 SpoIIE family protein phosphatase [Streptomyces ficellus]